MTLPEDLLKDQACQACLKLDTRHAVSAIILHPHELQDSSRIGPPIGKHGASIMYEERQFRAAHPHLYSAVLPHLDAYRESGASKKRQISLFLESICDRFTNVLLLILVNSVFCSMRRVILGEARD